MPGSAPTGQPKSAQGKRSPGVPGRASPWERHRIITITPQRGRINGWFAMGRQQFRAVGALGFQLVRLPRAALRWPWADRGCPVGAQKCCPVGTSGTQSPRPPDTTVPRVAWTKCPGGAAARGIRENVERSGWERSAMASCRCATPTREALSGPPGVAQMSEMNPGVVAHFCTLTLALSRRGRVNRTRHRDTQTPRPQKSP